jgi:hypothetical protein
LNNILSKRREFEIGEGTWVGKERGKTTRGEMGRIDTKGTRAHKRQQFSYIRM